MRSSKKKQSPGRQAGKKKSGDPSPKDTRAGASPPRPRAGLPAKDTIIAEKTLKTAKGNVYRILITDQMDAYDKPVRPAKKSRRKP